MSLMTYKDAVPWAESIRDELTAGRMPPWPMDPRSPAVKGMHPISAHDVDVIVTWAAGGTPRDWSGDIDKQLPTVALQNQWKLGQPDLVVSMESEYTLAANAVEETKDFSIPSGITRGEVGARRRSAARDAHDRARRDHQRRERANARAVAAGQRSAQPRRAAPRSASRRARSCTCRSTTRSITPRSRTRCRTGASIGLYFTDPPASGRELQSVSTSEKKASGESSGVENLKAALPGAGRVYALRPDARQGVRQRRHRRHHAGRQQISLLKLRGPRPQWFRRYWLQEAIELPGGSAIEARFTPLGDYSDEMKASVDRFPLQLAVDYVPQ